MKPRAHVFQGPNHDAGTGLFIPRLIMDSVSHPRVTNVSRSEYSIGSTSDATSLVYEDSVLIRWILMNNMSENMFRMLILRLSIWTQVRLVMCAKT